MPVYVQSILTPDPVYLQTKSYSAQSVRKWFADIYTPGVVNPNDYIVTLTSGLGISIAGGIAWVLGQNVSDQGMYRQYVIGSTALTVTTANVSNPRLDQVILRIMDSTHDGSGFSEARIEIVPGTATAGATLANRNGATSLTALGEASKSVLLLADILVPASASSLVAANLADRRVQCLLGSGMGGWSPGDIKETAYSTPDPGWLLCDGALVSRTTYARLYNKILFAYSPTPGTDPGSGNFYLPDFRGRQPVGLGSGSIVDTLGKSEGFTTVALRMGPRHGHGTHTHTFQQEEGGGSIIAGGVQFANGAANTGATQIGNAADPLHGGAFLVVNKMIKT